MYCWVVRRRCHRGISRVGRDHLTAATMHARTWHAAGFIPPDDCQVALPMRSGVLPPSRARQGLGHPLGAALQCTSILATSARVRVGCPGHVGDQGPCRWPLDPRDEGWRPPASIWAATPCQRTQAAGRKRQHETDRGARPPPQSRSTVTSSGRCRRSSAAVQHSIFMTPLLSGPQIARAAWGPGFVKVDRRIDPPKARQSPAAAAASAGRASRSCMLPSIIQTS